jgi:hypothetical protein
MTATAAAWVQERRYAAAWLPAARQQQHSPSMQASATAHSNKHTEQQLDQMRYDLLCACAARSSCLCVVCV